MCARAICKLICVHTCVPIVIWLIENAYSTKLFNAFLSSWIYACNWTSFLEKEFLTLPKVWRTFSNQINHILPRIACFESARIRHFNDRDRVFVSSRGRYTDKKCVAEWFYILLAIIETSESFLLHTHNCLTSCFSLIASKYLTKQSEKKSLCFKMGISRRARADRTVWGAEIRDELSYRNTARLLHWNERFQI